VFVVYVSQVVAIVIIIYVGGGFVGFWRMQFGQFFLRYNRNKQEFP
jgi:hypothetical protein